MPLVLIGIESRSSAQGRPASGIATSDSPGGEWPVAHTGVREVALAAGSTLQGTMRRWMVVDAADTVVALYVLRLAAQCIAERRGVIQHTRYRVGACA
jgi:hypothetical protein